jgi:hypothetical protein
MFLAGYVHRDISSGNLLYFEPGGTAGSRGIIGDLEYAKCYDDGSVGTDPKTVLTALRIAVLDGST